jgi:hypothetical protein
MLGIVTNLSLGGCYVETSGLLLPRTQLKLTFSYERASVSMNGEVVRMDMGIGAALKFNEPTHEVRAVLQRILEQLASAGTVVDLERSRKAAAGGTL